MNFQELYRKIASLDENVVEPQGGAGAGDECIEPSKTPGEGDFLAGECGGEMDVMPHPMSAPKQSDSVTMNVSMNGSGAGGIKDLLDILRNIENAGDSKDADDVLVGVGAEEAFDNEPKPEVAGVDAVTPTGDDLASKGKEALKVNGGGNPMRETLIAKLSEKYQTIKGE